jgi:hypothetical protein
MAREGPSSLQAATSVTLRETQGSRRNSQGEVPLSGAQALGIRPGAAAVHCNSECGCQKKSRSSGNGNPTKYNTTAVIDCSGNTGIAPSQSSKAWCCTLLANNGQGVFAYSTSEVPPTAHETLIHSVVTIPAEPSSMSNAMTCNMGK